ncbi:MAG: hypothetical protein QW445_01620 [Candidatus Bathyarchaeia archaeon]
MAKLGDLARVSYAIKTGANEFFYLDTERVKLWGIEKKFLEPLISSPKNIRIEIKPKDVNEWVLMVHEPIETLKNTNVLKYIEHGENVEVRIKGGNKGGTIVKGYHNLSSVKSRKTWYDLGEREPSPLLFSCRIWERCIFAVNKARAQADKAFYEIRPKNSKHINILAGILNSSLTALLAELHGRFYGGGVLELEIYECKDLPVLNPEKLSEKERRKIEEAFSKVCAAQNKGDAKLEQEARVELDNAVFDALKLKDKERKQVYEGLESLRRMRLSRKAVEVLVETAEQWTPPKKPRKERSKTAEPSKRLDTWMKE